MRNKREKEEAEEATTKLRELLKPGDTVYCILRHVSRSGMQRVIDLAIHTKDGPFNIGYLAARACGLRWDRDRGGVVVGGCGMDMGFHLVYETSYRVFRDDKRLARWKKKRGNGLTDPGYALRHCWL